ncbi:MULTISPECIES: hypothetical protein [Streptomyces]|uniref:Uncharacterized protein n=1 Tax=Streptomyces mordarskii TaxID=1226758 RepID=A0ABP3NZK3_9ACTN
MTAEPELPGVDEYADRLETAHRTSTWPGIPPADNTTAPGQPLQLELPHPTDEPTSTSHATRPTAIR